MHDASQPRIIYFPIRGRAEPIRLMLEELGISYVDEAVDYPRWATLKPEMPFGKVPVYREGDLCIAETQAIVRYLARRHDLYGRDAREMIHCDVLQEVLREAIDDLADVIWDPDFEAKRQAFIDETLGVTLAQLEQYLGGIARHDDYWVGEGLTLVDFVGWTLLDYTRALAGDLVAHHPRLAKLKKAFEGRPRIQAYLRSSRRPATITAPTAYFGGTPETS